MSEVSNKRFVHFDGTKEEFIDGGYPDQYQESIVFINGDGNESNNTIYTHGEYYGQGVIVEGDASNSAVLKNNNNDTLSEGSIALGKNNTVGLKGWYYKSIYKKSNTQIYVYLSDKQKILPIGDEALKNVEQTPDTKLPNVYDILGKDTVVSLINDNKHDNKFKIVGGGNGYVILNTLDGVDLPFSVIKAELLNDPDDYSIYCVSQPDKGMFDIGGYGLALGYGNMSTNGKSFAVGYGNHAYGKFSVAEGRETKAGYAAHAEGRENIASGNQSHAEGRYNTASADCSHAEGESTVASSACSHAEGNSTIASGYASHAEGSGTKALNKRAHAEGTDTTSSGESSHAEGYSTVASGYASHAEGAFVNANASYSHAEGTDTTAAGTRSHAEGNKTTTKGNYSHAEGSSSNKANIAEEDTVETIKQKWTKNKFSLAYGDGSHVEGANNLAIGEYSHAEGYFTEASGYASHAEGSGTTASHKRAHAEGTDTIASGESSHAEGYLTVASGYASHAEGNTTTAKGTNSHAEGSKTNSDGIYSHAEGEGTRALTRASHTEGHNTKAGKTADNDKRPSDVNNITDEGVIAHAEGISTWARGTASHTEGKYTVAYDKYSHAEGQNTYARGVASHASGLGTQTTNEAEFACGKYNVSNSGTIFSVGNGTSSKRKNAIEVKSNDVIISAKEINGTQGYIKLSDIIDTFKPNIYDESGNILEKKNIFVANNSDECFKDSGFCYLPAEEDTEGDIYVLEYDVNGEQHFIPICRNLTEIDANYNYLHKEYCSTFNIPIYNLNSHARNLTLIDNGLLHLSNPESISIVKKPINELTPIYSETDNTYIVINFEGYSDRILSIRNPFISIRTDTVMGISIGLWFSYLYNGSSYENIIVEEYFDINPLTRQNSITYVELPISGHEVNYSWYDNGEFQYIDSVSVYITWPIDLYLWVQRRTISIDGSDIQEQIDIGFVGLRDRYHNANSPNSYSPYIREIILGPSTTGKPNV